MDKQTRSALLAFKSRLRQRYGAHLKAVYLFGSRARGDHRPDSDADVAVFLDRVADPVTAQLELADVDYPILLETGLYIQPWVVQATGPVTSHRRGRSRLIGAVCRDGAPI